MLTKLSRQVSVRIPRRRFSTSGFDPVDLGGKLGILGVPFGKGQNKKGKDEAGLVVAPDFIRKTNFAKHLTNIGVEIIDYGNVQYKPDCELSAKNMRNLDHFAPCAKSVSDSVQRVLGDGRSCLVLGGDHSVAVGSIHGHLKVADPKKVAVIYVDAHADVNTNETSPSGNVHGMTVALLSRELKECWGDSFVPGLDWLSSRLSLKNVAYIGTRSVDAGEMKFLCQNGVAVFGIEDVDRCGIDRVLCEAFLKVDPFKNKSIHVSFDIDALDTLEAPCTTVPVRGGLSVREAILLSELLYKTGRLSVVDLVEVNAVIGSEYQRQITLDAAKQILLALFGHQRKGNKKLKPIT